MANNYEIPEIRCRTPKGLVDRLDAVDAPWQGPTWLFRGQNDESWELVPSAMRSATLDSVLNRGKTKFEKMKRDVYENATENESKEVDVNLKRRMHVAVQQTLETSVIDKFANLADMAGLVVPAYHYFPLGGDARERMTQHLSHLIPGGPEQSLEPKSIVFALAQHHGIPTRLLDWTYDPLVAAFFAAHEAVSLKKSPSHMVIWAVESSRLVTDTYLAVVTHQRARIGYLQAQDGAFLYDKAADDKYLSEGYWMPFEFELSRLIKNGAVYKLTLPFSKKVELLKLLRDKRVAPPYLMPSFDNVADDIMLEMDFWNDTSDSVQRFYR